MTVAGQTITDEQAKLLALRLRDECAGWNGEPLPEDGPTRTYVSVAEARASLAALTELQHRREAEAGAPDMAKFAAEWHGICQAIAVILGLPEPEIDFASKVRDKFDALAASPSSPASVKDELEALKSWDLAKALNHINLLVTLYEDEHPDHTFDGQLDHEVVQAASAFYHGYWAMRSAIAAERVDGIAENMPSREAMRAKMTSDPDEGPIGAAFPSTPVKALKWDGDEAKTPFGRYMVTRTDDGYLAAFEWDEVAHVGFNALDEPRRAAQDHAQADYEARIRSALGEHP